MDGGGDGGQDMCEYVFNPIMRNLQAMQRLINMMRNTQQDASCNDFECFTPNNPNSNPLINSQTNSLFSSTAFLVMGWMLFVFLLYFLRPRSFRQKAVDKKANANNSNHPSSSHRRRFYDNDDDDDGSPIS